MNMRTIIQSQVQVKDIDTNQRLISYNFLYIIISSIKKNNMYCQIKCNMDSIYTISLLIFIKIIKGILDEPIFKSNVKFHYRSSRTSHSNLGNHCSIFDSHSKISLNESPHTKQRIVYLNANININVHGKSFTMIKANNVAP